MAISSLSSSSPRFSAPSMTSTSSVGSTNKTSQSSQSTGDQSKAQLQSLSQLMKAIEQLLKSLKQDGFDSKSGGAGGGSPVGGAGGGSPMGGAGGGSPSGGAGGGSPAGGAGGGGGCGGASQTGGADQGGGMGSSGGAQGGPGGMDASAEHTPQDLANDPPTQAKGGSADKVAKDIEKEAEGWHYDNSGGQSFKDAMAQSKIEKPEKGGVCTDMAVAAARRFDKAGIEARVVDGEVKDKNGSGGGMHAWVQYKGDDGKWKEMDPTVAACSKDAPGALDPKNNNEFNYGAVKDIYSLNGDVQQL